jgi:hypothetical protein
MSSRVNIRTINGIKHNPTLPPKFRRAQNRAAAVFDAWDEFGETYPLGVIAHLHSLPVEQIHEDMYDDPRKIDKRFGTTKSNKIEPVLNTCLKELDSDIHPTLVAVANHIPFVIVRLLQDQRDVKRIANEFIQDMSKKLREIRQEDNEQLLESIDPVV